MACCNTKDILEEIPREDLPKLRDFYAKHLPHATHVYSFFNTVLKWMKMKPERQFMTIWAPYGDWKSHGTFIALMQWSCYDLFVFTMDPKCELLYKGLKETKMIDYANKAVLFYALHQKHRDAVLRALKESNVSIAFEIPTDIYWMPKDEAQNLKFECPEEYYIGILKREHAPIVNELWPHKYEGSVDFVATFIEMNGGHGIFTKSEDRLVSWILKCQMGTLALLQTVDDHKRKGLGSIATLSLSKEIALEGHNPLGTILQNNSASQAMFSKLGFTVLDWCTFIGAGNQELHKEVKLP